MAFLEVNGWTIPVASANRKHKLIGGKGRAYDGTPQTQDRGTKRVLECKTTRLKESARNAIVGIIRGDGYMFPFSSDLYSCKGWGPATGTDQATVTGSYAADGSLVGGMDHQNSASNVNTAAYSPTRSGRLSVNPAATNILGADSRDAENAPTGYTAVGGASIGANTDHYWQGTKSVYATIAGSGEGLKTAAVDPGAGSATKIYTGSVYIKNTSTAFTISTKLTMRDVTNGATATADTIIGTNQWARVACTIQIGGSDCRSLELELVSDTIGAYTFYADGFQVEESGRPLPDARVPTAWVDGARASADDLAYDVSFNSKVIDWSMGCWFYWGNNQTDAATVATLLKLSGADGSSIEIYRDGGTPTQLNAKITNEAGDSNTVTTTGGHIEQWAWNFIGLAFRADPETGEYKIELRLVNGSYQDTEVGSSSLKFAFDAIDTMYVGHDAGSDHWIGLINGLVVWPFYVPTEVWDGVAITIGSYGGGQLDDMPLPQWPRKYVQGDMVLHYPGRQHFDQDATFVGDVGGVDMSVGLVDDAFRSNLGSVSFVLEEV